MDTSVYPSTISSVDFYRRKSRRNSSIAKTKPVSTNPLVGEMKFRRIEQSDMPQIFEYLKSAPGRTTDFSYGGVLMWVDYFKYEFCIVNDTLFLKGVVEDDRSLPAFSLPVGKMSLADSVALLKDYCKAHGLPLEFSAVPEEAIDEFRALNPQSIRELNDWADYLYEAEKLSTLAGKKMSKKRNHVNKFRADYPDFVLEELTPDNCSEAMAMMDEFDKEGDATQQARDERALTRKLIEFKQNGDDNLLGALLKVGGKTVAFTIGDIKGDTLFVHVEKALREFSGSYEAINQMFAAMTCSQHPEILYINREDDAGDIGLRMAKESYHPCAMLRKYNVIF